MIRKSTTEWQGDGPSGRGSLSTESGALQEQPYSFKTRFQSGYGGREDGKAATNPEELLGAALAACFAMTVAFILTEAGHAPNRLKVTAAVDISKVGAGSPSRRSRSISKHRSRDSPLTNSESSPGSHRRTVQSRRRFLPLRSL